MAKTKKELVEEIKAAGGEDLNPNDYTVEQLEAKLAELSADGSESQTAEDNSAKLKVKVNPDKGSGSYLHPESKQVLVRDGDPVLLPDDAWTQDMVAKRFLIEVRK